MKAELNRVNHKIFLLEEKLAKLKQVRKAILVFMQTPAQKYVAANPTSIRKPRVTRKNRIPVGPTLDDILNDVL